MNLIADPPEKPDGVHPGVPTYDGPALLRRHSSQTATLMHPDLNSATTKVLAELFNQQTLVVVTGEAGLGKTLLLREVGRVLRAAEWRVVDETQIGSIFKRPTSGLTAVLIDGPGHISTRQMQHLLRLQNLAVVLALPDTAEPHFPFYAPVQLKPLMSDASNRFVVAWLQQTGTRLDLLTAEGTARLIEYSRGIPRHLTLLLRELAEQAERSAEPLSRRHVDEAARRLDLPTGSAPLPETNPVVTPERFGPEPHPMAGDPIAAPSFEPTPARQPNTGFGQRLPTNPGTAALTGLLCGIGAAIIALLLQDLLTTPRDDAAEDRAAQIISAPDAPQTPAGASTAASPSTPPPITRGERP